MFDLPKDESLSEGSATSVGIHLPQVKDHLAFQP